MGGTVPLLTRSSAGGAVFHAASRVGPERACVCVCMRVSVRACCSHAGQPLGPRRRRICPAFHILRKPLVRPAERALRQPPDSCRCLPAGPRMPCNETPVHNVAPLCASSYMGEHLSLLWDRRVAEFKRHFFVATHKGSLS